MTDGGVVVKEGKDAIGPPSVHRGGYQEAQREARIS